MKFIRKHQRVAMFLLLIIAIANLSMIVFATGESEGSSSGRLTDGSFENLKQFTNTYNQFSPSKDSPWKTTAETNLIELLRENKSTYIPGVIVKPSDGEYAAELNADEESSLYQIVSTEPSSIYEWGLDHSSRTASETMALIIGPNQSVVPSKNWGEGYESSDLNSQNPTLRTGYKYGKDQMMQMVAWLKATGQIGSTTENNGLANHGQAIILYSKKFAEHGEFQDNQDQQPFSMTPSAVYTEKWYIWIMTDHNVTTAGETNPWSSYGLNEQNISGGLELDSSKYYLYTVPSGQDKTLFAFTSVDNSPLPGKTTPDPTYGNFLDNVNFQLYHALSGSTTSHGSAVVGNSDGTSSGEGEVIGHEITADNSVATYVSDGQSLTIKAKISADEKENVTFAGVYYTVRDSDGKGSVTRFLSSNEEGWSLEGNEDATQDLIYSYDLLKVTSAVNLHFVFIKSPLVTYDVNGGKEYFCTPEGSNVKEEASNIYNFKPGNNETGLEFVEPYTSHPAEGQNKDWKFMGWQLFDDNGAIALLPGVHKVACNYKQGTGDEVAITQNFVILGEDGSFEEPERSNTSVKWPEKGEILYDDKSSGLTMVAQWRWRQIFVPQLKSGADYVDSKEGGTVSVTSIEHESDENYDKTYGKNGAVSYFAEVNETVKATATPKEGYCFEGWYDENGNQVSSSTEISYVETKESVNTYYARFAKKVPQYYKRQIFQNGTWETLADEDATLIPVLDHTYINESTGTVVSSTASNNESYGLIGWYDEDGNKVDDSMIYNNGKTIRYAIEKETTYYARYDKAVKVNFQMQLINKDGTFTDLKSSNSIASLSVESVNGIPGDVVSSKAYPKVGYQFVGWFDGNDNAAKEVSDIDDTDVKMIMPTLTSDAVKTYYARFTARTDTAYTVEHYFRNWNDGGTDKRLDSYTYYGTTGEIVTPMVTPKLSQPDRAGYVYESGIVSKPISADGKTVFRLYYIKTPTILTYVANPPEGLSVEGNVEPTSGYVDCSVTVQENAFSVEGYRFNGWNTNADGSGESYLPGASYTLQKNNEEDINPNTLYAQWIPKDSVEYKVQHIKLDKCGNKLEGSMEEESYYGVVDTNVTAKEKTYIGYSLDESKENISSGRIPPMEEGTLILRFYYKPETTTLTYKANGGIGNDDIKEGVVDEILSVEANEIDGNCKFTRPGYTFSGWKDPAGNSYPIGSGYTLTTGEDILLAQWSANTDTVYHVYHYQVSSDGTAADLVEREELYGTTGTFVIASPKEYAGYTYKYDFHSNGMQTVYHGMIAGGGSLVLKLYYIPDTVTLTYDPNGGVGSPVSKIGRYQDTISVMNQLFSREGYTFIGWNTDPSAENEGKAYYPNDVYTFGTTDETLYAQWEANTDTRYTVEHYKVNASGSEANLVDEEELIGSTDSEVIAVAHTYPGYTFEPFYINGDMKTVDRGYVKADGSLVLKLYYTPDKTSLIYHANGGNEPEKETFGKVDEQKLVLKNMFTRNGYLFTGWNTKSDGSGKAYAEGDIYTLTSGKNILYAQWEKEPENPDEPVNPDEPEKPENPDGPDDPEITEDIKKPNITNQNQDRAESITTSIEQITSIITGDNEPLIVWGVLMIVSAAMIGCMIWAKKKRKK